MCNWQIGKFRIQLFRSSPPWNENCYLVCHMPSKELAIIDPGDNAQLIIEAVLNCGANLRYIWLTHAHHDHVGAVASLCRHFGLVSDLHKNDVRLLRHAPMYAFRFAGKFIDTPESIRLFEDAAQFRLGDQPVYTMHTPGHTPGSVCYLFDGFVITGDVLLFQKIGRTDLPGGDSVLMKASINTLIKSLPGDTVILPGHSEAWTVAEAQDWWLLHKQNPPIYKTFEAG